MQYKQRHLSFAWGPGGGKEPLKNIDAFEIEERERDLVERPLPELSLRFVLPHRESPLMRARWSWLYLDRRRHKAQPYRAFFRSSRGHGPT